MATIETNDLIAEYNDDEATKQAVFDRVLEYFRKCETFSGESVHQCDDLIIYAPDVLADIADDILKFKVTWKE